MKCPRCACEQSDVLETRDWFEAFTRRRRRCFNGHPFYTYEVPATLLRRDLIPKVLRGLAERLLVWKRRETVKNDDGRTKTRTLARRLNISEARVRALRRELRQDK